MRAEPVRSLLLVDAVALKEQNEFLLKGSRPMMFRLIQNVSLDGLDIRMTHGKRAVTVLPAEIGFVRKRVVNPS